MAFRSRPHNQICYRGWRPTDVIQTLSDGLPDIARCAWLRAGGAVSHHHWQQAGWTAAHRRTPSHGDCAFASHRPAPCAAPRSPFGGKRLRLRCIADRGLAAGLAQQRECYKPGCVRDPVVRQWPERQVTLPASAAAILFICSSGTPVARATRSREPADSRIASWALSGLRAQAIASSLGITSKPGAPVLPVPAAFRARNSASARASFCHSTET